MLKLEKFRLIHNTYQLLPVMERLSPTVLHIKQTVQFRFIHFSRFINLTLNFSCWHILCIEKIIFTCGRRFDFQEHYRDSLQSVCITVLCNTGISDLLMAPTICHAHICLRLQNSCRIYYKWNLFSGHPMNILICIL